MDLTHASFFSGVGGLDLGLERAGWRTVSFSEIDPYACAVLAERWSGVPNLGDITDLARRDGLKGRAGTGGADYQLLRPDNLTRPGDARVAVDAGQGGTRCGPSGLDWQRATLWTGGFPCQDLSVAGKRRGMGTHADRLDSRSGLAYAFLDLVERHRPRAILLENVPGLLSSHRGRDMAALLGRLVELGYGVGYRVLDARYFGVPQRRRRVFIVGLTPGGRAGALRAAEVLSVGSRCHRHPPTGVETGPEAAAGPGRGIAHALTSSRSRSGRYDANGESYAIGSSPDPDRVRAPHGLAGRLDDRDGLVNALDQRRGGADDNEAQAGHLVAYVKRGRAQNADAPESWAEGDVMATLNGFDTGDARTTAAIMGSLREHTRPGSNTDYSVIGEFTIGDDPLLPLGLDSHRYRCCGNGVVADVAEWIGLRLAAALA